MNGVIPRRFLGKAELALVLGSGLSTLCELVEVEWAVPYSDLDVISSTSVEGHPGRLLMMNVEGSKVLTFSGRPHVYEGIGIEQAGAAASISAQMGCGRILLTQAAGGLHGGIAGGSWMLPSDLVTLPDVRFTASKKHGTGLSNLDGGMRCGSGTLISRKFRDELKTAAAEASVALLEGVLYWTPGPAYETRAEAAAAFLIGADAASMSALPELLCARRLGLKTACLTWITNQTANVTGEKLNHRDVLSMGKEGALSLLGLLEKLCAD